MCVQSVIYILRRLLSYRAICCNMPGRVIKKAVHAAADVSCIRYPTIIFTPVNKNYLKIVQKQLCASLEKQHQSTGVSFELNQSHLENIFLIISFYVHPFPLFSLSIREHPSVNPGFRNKMIWMCPVVKSPLTPPNR